MFVFVQRRRHPRQLVRVAHSMDRHDVLAIRHKSLHRVEAAIGVVQQPRLAVDERHAVRQLRAQAAVLRLVQYRNAKPTHQGLGERGNLAAAVADELRVFAQQCLDGVAIAAVGGLHEAL